MHASKVLHKLITRSAPSIHQTRLTSLIAAVTSAASGAKLCITSLGRGLSGPTLDKHKIKRVDRLVSNRHLYQECTKIYAALTEFVLANRSQPIIIIDWSPLCGDLSHQLLRAAVPVGGRSITLYEEVHPAAKLGNRRVQHRFMDRLAAIVPGNCSPIIVADSGFSTPFFRYVEEKLRWQWVGRIRGRHFLASAEDPTNWTSVKTLFGLATTRIKVLGPVLWVRNNPLLSHVLIVRNRKKNRKTLTMRDQKPRAKRNQVHVKRNTEPWVLVYSDSLSERPPHEIVSIYRRRMQIELGFRDCKSDSYGLGMCERRHVSIERRAVLCLIASCTTLLLWCLGKAVHGSKYLRGLRVNSSSARRPYSEIHIARLVSTRWNIWVSELSFRRAINQASKSIELAQL